MSLHHRRFATIASCTN